MNLNGGVGMAEHRDVIADRWWSSLDKKRTELRKAAVEDDSDDPAIQDSGNGDYRDYAADDPTLKVNVGNHYVYRPMTVDDLINILNDLRDNHLVGAGGVRVQSLIRTSGVTSRLTGVTVDYGRGEDGVETVIIGSDSWLPYEDNESLLAQDNENDDTDEDDEPGEDEVNRIVKAVHSIHEDDIAEINKMRINDEELYRVAKIADGIVTADSDERPRDDDTIHEAVLEAVRLTEERLL
jgi:hypothetical protein